MDTTSDSMRQIQKQSCSGNTNNCCLQDFFKFMLYMNVYNDPTYKK